MQLPRWSIGSATLLLLLRNLEATLQAGIPLSRALGLFEQQARGSARQTIAHLRRSVESGRSLAEAMETAPQRFPELTINLVRAGEMSGTLTHSLAEVASALERLRDLKRKIRNASMYPIFVLVAVMGLGLSIGTLVLPQLIPLFESLDVTLPFTTRVLLAVAKFFSQYGILVTIASIAGAVGLVFLTRLEPVKPFFHTFLLRIPLIGTVVRNAAVAQLSATLATLLKSGISLADAIPATAKTVGNRVLQRGLLATLPAVREGRTFSSGIAHAPFFPSMATAMIRVGEESGTLAEALHRLSVYEEAEVDYAVKALASMLEPVLLIGIGIIVGFTVMAIITPIYDITGSIR